MGLLVCILYKAIRVCISLITLCVCVYYVAFYSWTPDSKHIVTASRDGTCKVWRVIVPSTDSTVEGGGQGYDLLCIHTFTPFAGAAVTAVDISRFNPVPVSDLLSGAWLLVLGAENGDMQVRSVSCLDSSAQEVTEQLLLTVPDAHAHGATVRRIRWRPTPSATASVVRSLDFASCGEDKTVRVHRIVLG